MELVDKEKIIFLSIEIFPKGKAILKCLCYLYTVIVIKLQIAVDMRAVPVGYHANKMRKVAGQNSKVFF